MYILKCKDSYGDGWNGGFIKIQGTKYCKNFNSGTEKAVNVTIVDPGKYSIGQCWIPGIIKMSDKLPYF